MGVAIVAYLGFFVGLACVLLAAAALAFRAAPDAIRSGVPAIGFVPDGLVGPLLVAFAVLVGAASWGLLQRQPWAWVAALALVALSAAGDLARVLRRDPNGLVGIALVAILVAYLVRPEVRAWFLER